MEDKIVEAMEDKIVDKELEDLDVSAKFKSPIRQRLFRTCKSPFKPNPSSARSSTPVKTVPKVPRSSTNLKSISKESASKRGLEIGALVEKFPEIHENFEITKKAGEGTFSKVYLAKLRADHNQIFALKHLIPTSSPGRIENELKCLQVLGGAHNVLPIRSVLRNGDHIIFILPYVPHSKFTDYMPQMSVEDIRIYMYHLLTSLKHVHRLGIIHRDIKPSNFLYSQKLDRYYLIDFGLAMPVPGSKDNMLNDYTNSCTVTAPMPNNAKLSGNRVRPNANNCKHAANSICDCCKGRARQNAPRAGTPGFRSPEVLLRHPNQTTAVDMWATGVILLSMLSRRYPFFKAKDDMEALAQIVTVFGSSKMKKMADSIDKDFVCVPVVEKVGDLKSLCERLAQRLCILNKNNLNTSESMRQDKKRKRAESADGALLESPKRNTPSKFVPGIASKSESDISRVDKKADKCLPVEEKENMSRDTREKENISRDAQEKENFSKDTPTNCNCKNCAAIPNSVYNLLDRLMELDPYKRISAEEALKHPFIENR